MPEIYHLNDDNRSSDAATLLAASALAGNGGGWGGFGNNPLAMAFMFPFIMPFVMPFMNMMYGNGGWGGFGNWGGNGGAGFISNQLNNDAGRQLIMQAIQGNASAIDRLASILNTTHDQVQEGICSLNTSVLSVGNNVNMTGLQIINAMQSGNTALQSQICQGFANLMNNVTAGHSDIKNTINAKAAADQLQNCQLRYDLTENMNRGFLALDNKIDALESARKDREITALTAQVAKLEGEKYTAGVVQQAVAPVLGQLAAIGSEVEAIKRCQPQTITLPNNQYTAVPTLVANAGADFIASYWANRLSQATAGATAGGGAATPAATAVK